MSSIMSSINLIGVLDTGIKICYEGESIHPDYGTMHTRALEIINNNKWDKANKRIQY